MTDRRLVVLAGGLTHERDVSLRSGRRVADALRRHGHDVVVRDADATLLPYLAEHRPDAAVIALHGGRGENGAVQGVLEMAGIPCVGSSAQHCRLAWDKDTAKTLMRDAGFATPDWISLSHSVFRDLGADTLIDALVQHLGLPLILKPHQGGSALGAGVVRDREALPARLVDTFAYGDVALVERFVSGVEIAVTVVADQGEPRALPAVEIAPPGDVFDYEARYTAGLTTYYTPARLDPAAAAAAADLALGAHRVLGLRDVSRTDAIVAPDGSVEFLEVNVSPGLTETSMLPMAVAADGGDLGALYSALVENAMARSAPLPS